MVEVNKKAPEARKARMEAGGIVGGHLTTQLKGSEQEANLQTSTEENATQRPYFTFYRSFRDAIAKLPDGEQLAIYKAIADFALDGVEPDGELLCGIGSVIWELIRPNLVASWRKYEVGKMGGAPKGNKNNPQGRGARTNQELTTNQPRTNQELTNNRIIDKGVIDKGEIEKENIRVEGKPQPQTAKRFSPPSIVEVDSYIKEMGYTNVNAEEFVDYYTSKGWKVGNAPMKDWKASARQWERRNKETIINTPNYGKDKRTTSIGGNSKLFSGDYSQGFV